MKTGKSLVLTVVVLIMSLLLLPACSGDTAGPSGGEGPERGYELSEAHLAPQEGKANELERPEKASQEWVVGAAFPMMNNLHCISQAYGFIDECEQLGVKPILLESGGYENVDKHINQLQDLISRPVDAIYLFTANSASSAALVDTAVEQGIPVINVNVMTDSDNVVTRIRSDDDAIGRAQAEVMAKELGGKGNVIALAGPPGTTWAIGRFEGFKAYMEENHPDIKILDVQYSSYSIEEGTRLMEDMMQTYPDIDGVMTGADGFGMGAGLVLEGLGLQGKIIITTTDTQPDCLNMIREGTITATVAQAPVLLGRFGARAAVMTLEGKADDLLKEYYPPVTVITKENVDSIDLTTISYPPEGWKPPIN